MSVRLPDGAHKTNLITLLKVLLIGCPSLKDAYRALDLKALKCFMAVAQTGSLTRAGIELGISEPAVSQRVKGLERYLGTKLYEARGGRVRLTAAGEQLLVAGVGLFDQLAELENTLGEVGPAGRVTIAAEDAPQLYLLPDVVRQCTRDFPRVQLRLLSRPPDQIVELVRENEADLGIIAERPLPAGLIFHAWKTFNAYVLIPLGHPLVRRGIPRLDELLNEATVARYPLVLAESQDTRGRIEQALRRQGLPLNVAFEVGTIEAVKRYVAMGLGIGVVAGICLTEDDSERLVSIPVPSGLGGMTTYGVVLREGKHITRALGALLPMVGISAENSNQEPEGRAPSDGRAPGR